MATATAPVIANIPESLVTRDMEQLVKESMPAVRFLAMRMVARIPSGVDLDDLVQVGLIGLLQSADRFDPQRGVKFQTYASRRVQGAMLDYLRSLDWKPRSVRAKNRKLEIALHATEQRLGEKASDEDLADEIGISVQELEQWIDRSGGPQSVTASEEGALARALESLPDFSDSPEDAIEKKQMQRLLVEAVDALPKSERLVLSLYYYEQLTMREIGDVMGVRQARISQLHSQAISRLRNRMRRTLESRSVRRPSIPCPSAPQPKPQPNRTSRIAAVLTAQPV